MKLLDLFCGQGGASMGYHRAGFEVTGVDAQPQPRYPFPFLQGDALQAELRGFDVVHASPPCQRYSPIARRVANCYPDLLGPVRARLQAWGGTWVIENVPRAPMRADMILCGSAFGLPLRRHRAFESSVPLGLAPPCRHWGKVGEDGRGGGKPGAFVGVYGRPNRWRGSTAEWLVAMGCEWMDHEGVVEAIPPVFTEFIGRRLAA